MSIPIAWHKVAGPEDLADGALIPAVAGGKALVLARQGDRYSALDDRCPHAGGPLSQGSLENGLLVCPWHGREVDPATGKCEGLQSVGTYPVEVRADGIFVAA